MASTIFGQVITIQTDVKLPGEEGTAHKTWTPNDAIQMELISLRSNHPTEFNCIITLAEQALKQSVEMAAIVIYTLSSASKSGTFSETLAMLTASTEMPPNLSAVIDHQGPVTIKTAHDTSPFGGQSPFDKHIF